MAGALLALLAANGHTLKWYWTLSGNYLRFTWNPLSYGDDYLQNNRAFKSALIMEGGAMRGLFTCGVLDVFSAGKMPAW